MTFDIEATLTVPDPDPKKPPRATVNVTLEVEDYGYDGYQVQTISVETPMERRPWMSIGRDHPLFPVLEACVNPLHIETVIQERKEEMAA